jgi:hypothetical protein
MHDGKRTRGAVIAWDLVDLALPKLIGHAINTTDDTYEIWSDLVILLPRRIICILVVFIVAAVVLVVVAF